MPKNVMIIPIGRPRYLVQGQGRGAKYPQVSLPEAADMEIGTPVYFSKVIMPGTISLAPGDIVIRRLPKKEG